MFNASFRFLFRPLLTVAFHPVLLLGMTLACSSASSRAENLALKLDGRGSYVEMPAEGYSDLTQSTLEAWVKWDALRTYSRVFEFGIQWKSVFVMNQGTTPDLRFNIYPSTNATSRHTIWATNGIRTKEWMHVAAVSGPGGMLLYVNGRLMGQHTNAASFAAVADGARFVLGRGLVANPGDQDFEGEMDEIRIWNYRRSATQIREGMFKRLTGNEAGLVRLWNFDDGNAKDATAHAAHGKLLGSAMIVPSDLGLVGEVAAPPPVAATPVPAAPQPTQVVEVRASGSGAVGWWIAGAITLLAVVLAWLAFMFRRSGLGSEKIVGVQPAIARISAEAALPEHAAAAPVTRELKEQALAELTSFAKESLVQGLFTQRAALLEAQRQAQQELAQLETRLAKLDVQDRILAYETRIADLERKVADRGEQVEGLTKATLQLLRSKLAEERAGRSAAPRFN